MGGQLQHLAPATGCGCGLYAVHDIDQLQRFPNLPDDFVLAGVAGTGIVRVHTDGWRAQFARIVAFSMELPILEIQTSSISVPDALTPRERRVLQLRFGLIDGHQRTLEEVGKKFGVAQERIREIEAKALWKLVSSWIEAKANRKRVSSRGTSVPRRLSATVAEALEAKYQVPVVPLDRLKEVMAGAGNFWEGVR